MFKVSTASLSYGYSNAAEIILSGVIIICVVLRTVLINQQPLKIFLNKGRGLVILKVTC